MGQVIPVNDRKGTQAARGHIRGPACAESGPIMILNCECFLQGVRRDLVSETWKSGSRVMRLNTYVSEYSENKDKAIQMLQEGVW